jgi:hypothetical protein
MRNVKCIISLIAGAALLVSTIGCEQLPGTKEQQGAVIGGASGAVVGAVVGGEHKVLGALIGGLLGAGGGYLIGANIDKITGKDSSGAERASAEAQRNPATPDEAKKATTADINKDGFVTLDEVVAMEQAGFSDEEILNRLRSSGQVFELTDQQRQYLRNHGVSQSVVGQMENLNREQRDKVIQQQQQQDTSVIGRPAPTK